MRDQASSLRNLAGDSDRGIDASLLPDADFASMAVLSGKGGVGKSSLSLNLGLAFAEMDERVLLFDADLGMANLDTLIGKTPSCGLEEVVRGELELSDALMQVEEDVFLLPGFSGVAELVSLSPSRLERIRRQFPQLNGRFDRVIFDCSAGGSSAVVRMAASSDAPLLITTPEPTALVDAYSVLKIVSAEHEVERFRLVVNMARNETDGSKAAKKLETVCSRHLDLELEMVGVIPRDPAADRASRQQIPLLRYDETSPASRSIRRIASRLAGVSAPDQKLSFWQRLFSN